MENIITIQRDRLVKFLRYDLIIDIFLSVIMIAFFAFIAFLFISGKGHFELKSSLWIFLVFFAGAGCVYKTMQLVADCRQVETSVLECKEASMMLGNHKSFYHINYVDKNGQSAKKMIRVAVKSKPFRFFVTKTPIKFYYTKRTKILLGLETEGKTIWIYEKDKS